MLRLQRTNGNCEFFAPQHIVLCRPVSPEGSDTHVHTTAGDWIPVRESPEEIARLVDEALRPAPTVDPKAMALARQLIERLAAAADAGLPIIAWSHVDPILGLGGDGMASHGASAAALRALAARLGAP